MLRGDDVEVWLKRAVREEDFSLDDLFEWPLFRDLRTRPEFANLIERVFGPGWKSPVERFPASVLDLSSAFTLERLVEELKEIGRARAKTETTVVADEPSGGAIH